jgi:hypothetical protein
VPRTPRGRGGAGRGGGGGDRTVGTVRQYLQWEVVWRGTQESFPNCCGSGMTLSGDPLALYCDPNRPIVDDISNKSVSLFFFRFIRIEVKTFARIGFKKCN